jgi:MFS family permease
MQNAAGGWLMTTLTSDPRIISLVQVASSLPMFLLGLPAGALADIFDRRRLLLLMESVITALTVAFTLLMVYGRVTPEVLLGFVFLSSTAAASIAPAWQAIVPQLVETRADLAPAVALDSVSVNISRAIGPAIAGVIIVAWGLAAPFSINGLCNLACIGALFWWRPGQGPVRDLPAERFSQAIRLGLRHARYNRPLRAALTRAAGFFPFASAYWALLPLLAQQQIAGGPQTYGLLLGAIGCGAILGTFTLRPLESRLGSGRTMGVGSVGTAAALFLFAVADGLYLGLLAGLVAGVSWIIVLSTLNVSAQVALPAWVRGRGLAVYTTVVFGAMALGSLVWGELASLYGLPAAHLTAGAGTLLGLVLLRRHRLVEGAGPDLTPSMYLPQPLVTDDIDGDRGPVLVTAEYRIDPAERAAFLAAIHRQGLALRRNGAYRWGIFEDTASRDRWIETFVVDSWLEYLRQQERVTKADRSVADEVSRCQHGEPPLVRHFIAP